MPQVNRPPLDPNQPSIAATVGGLASSAVSATSAALGSLAKERDAASGADPSVGDIVLDSKGRAVEALKAIPGVSTPLPVPTVPDLKAPPALTLPPTANATGDLDKTVSQLLEAAVVANPLNGFFQIVHHFRLFMANDMDLEMAKNAATGGASATTTSGSTTATSTPTATPSTPAGGTPPAASAPAQTVAPGAAGATSTPTPGALAAANVNTGLDTSGLSPAEIRIKQSIASFPEGLARLRGGAPVSPPAAYGPPVPPGLGAAPAAPAAAPATTTDGSATSKAVSATATQPSSVASTLPTNGVGGISSLTNSDILKVLDGLPQITIAESGVTTYNIKDVVIESFIGPQAETRNVNTTKFTITVAEPMGVGFLDAFKDSAAQVNINNPQKSIYYLELTFRGYNPDGTYNTNPLQGLVPENGARWVWQIKITNVDVSLDAGGGTYKLDAMPYAESAYDDDLLRSPDLFLVPGGSLGSAAKTMMVNLTAARAHRYGGDQVTWKPPVWHPITGGPLAGKNAEEFKFIKSKSEENPSRSFSMTTETDEPIITVNKGTSVADFFDFMLVNTKETQDMALDRDGRTGENNGTDTATNNKKFRESYIFRIEPDIKVTGYDFYSQNYKREVTYHLFPFYSQAPVTDEQQPMDAQSPETQEAMLRALLAQDFINKRYDYIFSGLNTEVTRFDVNFNFAWNVVIASSDGANTGYDNRGSAARTSDATAKGNDEENKTKVIVQQIAAATAVLNDRKSTKANVIANNDSFNQQIAAIQAKPITPKDYLELQDLQKKRAANLALQVTVDKEFDDDLAKYNALAQSTQQVNVPPAVGSPAFAEQIFADKINGTGNTLPHPISFEQMQAMATAPAGTGTQGDWHKDKTVFGTVLGQLYAPLAKQFMAVTMEIRGDPFWLGQTNLQRQSFLRDPKRVAAQTTQAAADLAKSQGKTPDPNTPKPTKLPDWTRGDIIFALEFKYPLGLGENLAPIFKKDEVFFGLYKANKVEHHFSSDGFFKQNITGYRLPLHSLNTALGAPPPGKEPTSTTPTASGTPAMTPPATGTMAPGAAAATATPAAGSLANANVNLGNTTGSAATGSLSPDEVQLRKSIIATEASAVTLRDAAGTAIPPVSQSFIDSAASAKADLAAAGISPSGRVNIAPPPPGQGGLTGLGGLVSAPSPLDSPAAAPAQPAYNPAPPPPAAPPANPNLMLPQRY